MYLVQRMAECVDDDCWPPFEEEEDGLGKELVSEGIWVEIIVELNE